MTGVPPPQLREFIRNSGVRVEQGEQNANYGEFAQFMNNDINFEKVTPVTTTNLTYTTFRAEVGPVARPDVLSFVKNTKPLRTNGIYDVQEIAGYYGQFQKGVSHSNLYGFQVSPELDMSELKNKTWTYIEFRVLVNKTDSILVRLYQGKMMLQGGMGPDPETPLNVARYIAAKYLKQNSADMNIKFSKIDGSFRFNATFNPQQVSRTLLQNGISHMYEPEIHNPNEIKNISYKGVVINALVASGYGRLHNARSIPEIQQMFKVAKELIAMLDSKDLLTKTSNYPPVTKRKRTNASPVQVRVPRVEKLRNTTNTLLNGKLCSTYSIDTLKNICKAMGIYTKKSWKKQDYCKAIFDKATNVMLANPNKPINTTTKNNLYKKRRINDTSIRNMLTKVKSPNVNRALQRVKRTMSTLRSNKKGVPFKRNVQKAAQNVAKSQKMLSKHLNNTLKTYRNLNENTRRVIANRVKAANVNTPAAINAAVKRNVEIARLNMTQNQKNEIYNHLKNKNANVNVREYARMYKLIDEYSRVAEKPRNTRQTALLWLKNRATVPSNANVKAKLVNIMKINNNSMNLNLMNKLAKARNSRMSTNNNRVAQTLLNLRAGKKPT
ncbi:hypothetical protein [Dishui Lake phycodnavirus 2]|nr:hypothetical protein [Dishui Lake phycodnavirus 2]